MSFGAVYFFFQKDANPCLKTKNSREKLRNQGAITQLELLSPMFGEYFLFFFYGIFNRIDEIAGGFSSEVSSKMESARIIFFW